MRLWVTLPVALLGLACASAQSYGRRPDGRAMTSLAPASAKTVVLYFVASDCPVSNRTMPEMLRVRQEFAERGVAFWFVYPNTGETLQSMKQHLAAFGAGNDAVLDAAGGLVEMTHVRVTPEVAVLVREGAGWKTVYAGRVDNRYVRLGVERPQATEHYAEQVVNEVLEGRAVQAAVGNPVGCAIVNPKASLLDSEGQNAKMPGGAKP